MVLPVECLRRAAGDVDVSARGHQSHDFEFHFSGNMDNNNLSADVTDPRGSQHSARLGITDPGLAQRSDHAGDAIGPQIPSNAGGPIASPPTATAGRFDSPQRHRHHHRNQQQQEGQCSIPRGAASSLAHDPGFATSAPASEPWSMYPSAHPDVVTQRAQSQQQMPQQLGEHHIVLPSTEMQDVLGHVGTTTTRFQASSLHPPAGTLSDPTSAYASITQHPLTFVVTCSHPVSSTADDPSSQTTKAIPLHPVTHCNHGHVQPSYATNESFACVHSQQPTQTEAHTTTTRHLDSFRENVGDPGPLPKLVIEGGILVSGGVGTGSEVRIGGTGIGVSGASGGRVSKKGGGGQLQGRGAAERGTAVAAATVEALGMHKILDHKHWAAVYIKPNSVYKRRAFSSLKSRKRRDLVTAGFAVFHKICDSLSNGEADDFMKAVMQSSRSQRVTKTSRAKRDNFDSNAFLQQQALAYSMAPGGPNGRIRVLTTVVNLLTEAEIQQSFKRVNGECPTAYEMSLARSQFAATGAADQPPTTLSPQHIAQQLHSYAHPGFLAAVEDALEGPGITDGGNGGYHIERAGNHRVCANHMGHQIVPLVCGDQCGTIGSVPHDPGGRNSGAISVVSSHDGCSDQGGAVCASAQQCHRLSSNHHLPQRPHSPECVRVDENEVIGGARAESDPPAQCVAPAGGPQWGGKEGITVQDAGEVGRENADIEGRDALVEQPLSSAPEAGREASFNRGNVGGCPASPGLTNNHGVVIFVESERVVAGEAGVLPPGMSLEAPSDDAGGLSSVGSMGLGSDNVVERGSVEDVVASGREENNACGIVQTMGGESEMFSAIGRDIGLRASDDGREVGHKRPRSSVEALIYTQDQFVENGNCDTRSGGRDGGCYGRDPGFPRRC